MKTAIFAITNLHRALVNLDAVILLGGSGGMLGLVEFDSCHSAGATVGTISKGSATDGSNDLLKVLLYVAS